MLFWGLREPKRVQLLTVDRPRIDVQCGDTILKSPRIEDYIHCPNFPINVLYMDLVSTLRVHVCVYLRVCICMYMCMCMYACICVCMYVRSCSCVYVWVGDGCVCV